MGNEELDHRWYQMKERLPEDGTYVWVWLGKTASPSMSMASFAAGHFYFDDEFSDAESPESPSFAGTHWHPIEQPFPPMTVTVDALMKQRAASLLSDVRRLTQSPLDDAEFKSLINVLSKLAE